MTKKPRVPLKTKIDDWPMERSATISPCNSFRYDLVRIWDKSLPKLMIIGLNCSTADAIKNDPTVRREIVFGMDLGFGSLYKANLFAFRTPSPKVMKKAEDPIGPKNDDAIFEMAKNAHTIVAAWGTHGSYLDRDVHVLTMLMMHKFPIYCFGLTDGGFPKHPLYVKASTKLQPWKLYDSVTPARIKRDTENNEGDVRCPDGIISDSTSFCSGC